MVVNTVTVKKIGLMIIVMVNGIDGHSISVIVTVKVVRYTLKLNMHI